MKRWFFWYTRRGGIVTGVGPMYMTDQEAFALQFNTEFDYLTIEMFRFAWTPSGVWVYDTRSGAALLAGRALPSTGVA
jgi:hypothetical protein